LDHEKHDMRKPRETTTAAMGQAIPRLAGDIASGRVEDLHSFSQKTRTECGFFVKKI